MGSNGQDDNKRSKPTNWRFLNPKYLYSIVSRVWKRPKPEPESEPPAPVDERHWTFRRDRPRLIVMLYGASEDPLVTQAEPKPGTSCYGRFKWGFQLVRNLLGHGGDTLHTYSGQTLQADTWETHALDEDDNGSFFFAVEPFHGETPALSILIPCRDGSVHLMEQVKATIDSVYRLYTERFPEIKDQPSILWVTHSMGGSVVRSLLTNPTEEIEGVALAPEERERAEFLADRTLYMVSLAVPHEGSCVADKADDIRDFLQAGLEPMRELLNMMNIWEQVMVFLTATTAIRHIETNLWKRLNQGVLAPHRMNRSDGTLIPNYVLTGRYPAGRYYRDPEQYPLGGIPITEFLNARPSLEAIGLMALDWAMYNAPGCTDTWGCTFCDDLPLDTVARYFREKLGTRISDPGERPGEGEVGFPIFYVGGKGGDGNMDADGMVAVDSALGVRLGTDQEEYFDHKKTWEVEGQTMRGSWYRYYTGPWDGTNHGSILQEPETAEWLAQNVLPEAGPYVNDGELSGWIVPETKGTTVSVESATPASQTLVRSS